MPKTLADPDQIRPSVSNGQVLTTVAGAAAWSDPAANLFAAELKGASPASAGMVASRHPSGTGVILADATDDTKNAVGLFTAAAIVGAVATIQTGGVLTLADWTASAGAPTLPANAKYWLATAPGTMVTSSPISPLNVSQEIGVSVSPTQFLIMVESPIVL